MSVESVEWDEPPRERLPKKSDGTFREKLIDFLKDQWEDLKYRYR